MWGMKPISATREKHRQPELRAMGLGGAAGLGAGGKFFCDSSQAALPFIDQSLQLTAPHLDKMLSP